MLRRVAVERFAVHLNGHLGDDGEIGQFANGLEGLLDHRDLGKGLQHENIDPAFEQSLDLLLVHVPSLVVRRWAEWLQTQAKRADGTSDEGLFARGFTRDARSRHIDLADPAFEAVRLKLVTSRTKRIGLNDVGACRHVFAVDLADQIGSDKVQLVVAAVDVHAFVI